jgi:hypothetical protein
VTTTIDAARAVADAVLYEGYVLYPYRATSSKNVVRWQWGVLMPQDVVAVDGSERSWQRTDVVLDGVAPTLRVTIRFLQVQRRYVEDPAGTRVDRLETEDATYLPWDEAREQEHTVVLPLDEPFDTTVDVPGGVETELLPDGAGSLVRVREPVAFGITATAEQPVSPYPVTMVSIRVSNRTRPLADPGAGRSEWLRRALVASHLLLEVDGADLVSQLEPPEWAKGYVDACASDGVFPVLAGPPDQRRVGLSSPIILYDHAQVAPESETSFFDSLEIDELLSLRTITLTEAEKREVRGTDPRAAGLLREVDDMPPELWDRLHGAVRQLDARASIVPPAATNVVAEPSDVPWWDPGSDATVDPEHDAVRVLDVDVRRGTRVILRPGVRRADAYDLFLAGRTATVAAVLRDVDGHDHLAVTVDDDPGADLKVAHGRYLYFAPDEVEPLGEGSGPG